MMAIMSFMKIYTYSNVVVWVQVVGMFGQEPLRSEDLYWMKLMVGLCLAHSA